MGGQRDRERAQLLGVHLIQRGVDRGLLASATRAANAACFAVSSPFGVTASSVGYGWSSTSRSRRPVVVWIGHRRYHLS
jgi:hypothetical protein